MIGWTPPTPPATPMAKDQDYSGHLRRAIVDLTRQLDATVTELERADYYSRELRQFYAVEYVEDSHMDDIRAHLADAARAVRAARALHEVARRDTLGEGAE